jgi:hypothetical protein
MKTASKGAMAIRNKSISERKRSGIKRDQERLLYVLGCGDEWLFKEKNNSLRTKDEFNEVNGFETPNFRTTFLSR